MKKAYINPLMEIVNIETRQQVLTASVGFGEGTKNPGLSDARSFDFDDDEE